MTRLIDFLTLVISNTFSFVSIVLAIPTSGF